MQCKNKHLITYIEHNKLPLSKPPPTKAVMVEIILGRQPSSKGGGSKPVAKRRRRRGDSDDDSDGGSSSDDDGAAPPAAKRPCSQSALACCSHPSQSSTALTKQNCHSNCWAARNWYKCPGCKKSMSLCLWNNAGGIQPAPADGWLGSQHVTLKDLKSSVADPKPLKNKGFHCDQCYHGTWKDLKI